MRHVSVAAATTSYTAPAEMSSRRPPGRHTLIIAQTPRILPRAQFSELKQLLLRERRTLGWSELIIAAELAVVWATARRTIQTARMVALNRDCATFTNDGTIHGMRVVLTRQFVLIRQ